MTDPLSVAASVTSLVALAGATSTTFYQFFHSIHEAPSSARELASGLFSLNVVVSQVQEVLLNPDFVQQSEDPDADTLAESLTHARRCSRRLRRDSHNQIWRALTKELYEKYGQACGGRLSRMT